MSLLLRLSYPASFFQDFEYFRKLLPPFFSSCTDWCQLCLKNLVQEFLHFDITQTSTLIVRFQFIQILIFRPEFFEIFILAECIQINELPDCLLPVQDLPRARWFGSVNMDITFFLQHLLHQKDRYSFQVICSSWPFHRYPEVLSMTC